MDELLPCPVCGSSDVALRGKTSGERFTSYVQCARCGHKGGMMYGNKHSSAATFERAINDWNSRADE